MRMEASGHHNITCQHKNTFEFTAESEVARTGDCIVAVNLKFDKSGLKRVLSYKKVKITIKAGNSREEIFAYINPKFSDAGEFIIRKSDFVCKRTLAVKANKSAFEFGDSLKKKLANPKQKIIIIIEPVKIKAIVFDFDNTLERWEFPEHQIERVMAEIVSKKYGLDKNIFFNHFALTREFFVANQKTPVDLDRRNWYSKVFKDLNFKISKKGIDELNSLYWGTILRKVSLFPEVISILKKLKPKYKLAILSNSDGIKKVKIDRIKFLKIDKYFDFISTSDDVGFNKPHASNFIFITKKLKVSPGECLMVGDNPSTDLVGAKPLGFTTVLVRKSRHYQNKSINFADYDFKNLKQIPKIVEVLNR